MRIADLYRQAGPVISFEFFPPRTDAGYRSLYRTLAELKRLEPGFVSVTWGAGGSTRRLTAELVGRIQRELGLTAMAHMTCVGARPETLASTLEGLVRDGIENLLALRGDPPRNDPDWTPESDHFQHAIDLVRFIRARFDLCIGAACHPEGHPDRESPEAEIRHLAAKVQAGAEFLITQFFFDNRDYFDFLGRTRSAGIEVPIVPGIMPVVSASGIRRMAALAGARIPEALEARIAEAGEDDGRIAEAGIDWATQQCRELLDAGVPGLHFYTLNRSPATREVYRNLFGR